MNLFSSHQGEKATKTPHQKSVIKPSHTLENQTLKHTGNSWIQALTQSETPRDPNLHSQERLQVVMEGHGSKRRIQKLKHSTKDGRSHARKVTARQMFSVRRTAATHSFTPAKTLRLATFTQKFYHQEKGLHHTTHGAVKTRQKH
jgi:hypothetical protein